RSATLADIYGSLFSGNPTGAAPPRPPAWELSTGYRFINDPLIDNDHSLILEARYRHRRLFAELQTSLTPPLDNYKAALFGGYELYRSTSPGDGSFFLVKGGLTCRRYKSEGFSTLTGEVFAHGRLDLYHYLPTLRGSFMEIGAGAALRGMGYDALDGGVMTDREIIPLFRFAFGAYLGTSGSELSLFYDHRHDDELGGLAMGSGGDGVIGHFGVEMTWWFSPRLGVRALVAAGSAHLYQLTLTAREK
ncbi:hypothetical protein KJ865_16905, partial [Myxococcota bacterium]|nr:hypothetical protein [Myxococcota bacterium]